MRCQTFRICNQGGKNLNLNLHVISLFIDWSIRHRRWFENTYWFRKTEKGDTAFNSLVFSTVLYIL